MSDLCWYETELEKDYLKQILTVLDAERFIEEQMVREYEKKYRQF